MCNNQILDCSDLDSLKQEFGKVFLKYQKELYKVSPNKQLVELMQKQLEELKEIIHTLEEE